MTIGTIVQVPLVLSLTRWRCGKMMEVTGRGFPPHQPSNSGLRGAIVTCEWINSGRIVGRLSCIEERDGEGWRGRACCEDTSVGRSYTGRWLHPGSCRCLGVCRHLSLGLMAYLPTAEVGGPRRRGVLPSVARSTPRAASSAPVARVSRDCTSTGSLGRCAAVRGEGGSE